MNLLVPPVYEAGGVRAPDVRALLSKGAIPRRLDPAGVAAYLWRGAAMGARLPVAGVARVSGPAPLCDETPNPPRTTPDDVRRALAAVVAAPGRPLRLLRATGVAARALRAVAPWNEPEPLRDGPTKAAADPGSRLEDLVAEGRVVALDMPGAEGFAISSAFARDGSPGHSSTLLSTAGAEEAFGLGPLYGEFAASGRRRRGPRAAAGGDALDVAAQRARDVEALATVDAHRFHALAGLLPAATRQSVSRAGPRPPDGISPGTTGLALASDLARRGPLVDRALVPLEAAARARGLRVCCPFLDPAVVAAVRGLPSAVRFGAPGSGGLLASWGGAEHGEAPAWWRASVEASTRSENGLAAYVRHALDRSRVSAQGLLDPDAVEDALGRFRRGEGGWTGEAILTLALLSDWVEREGLSLDGGPA